MSDFDPGRALTVGRVLAPHGVHGEFKVEPLTDFPERFEPGSVLYVDGKPHTVERGRWQKRSVIVKLQGIDSRTEAEALRGREIQAMPAAGGLEPDTYYRDDLIGLKVVDTAGQALGEVADIFSTGSNDVYVVRGPRGELLLPATDDVVTGIDLERRQVRVEVVEGLEWTPPPGAGRKRAASARAGRRPGP